MPTLDFQTGAEFLGSYYQELTDLTETRFRVERDCFWIAAFALACVAFGLIADIIWLVGLGVSAGGVGLMLACYYAILTVRIRNARLRLESFRNLAVRSVGSALSHQSYEPGPNPHRCCIRRPPLPTPPGHQARRPTRRVAKAEPQCDKAFPLHSLRI